VPSDGISCTTCLAGLDCEVGRKAAGYAYAFRSNPLTGRARAHREDASEARQQSRSEVARQELTANAIDKIGDPTAPPEERAQRRRRLTKGPEEFQAERVDRPKLKGTNR
jgi:hypothetical protein